MPQGNRLSHTNQPAPMPRDFGQGNDLPHPELIRNIDGHDWCGGRNVAEPFGTNTEPEPDGDDFPQESGY